MLLLTKQIVEKALSYNVGMMSDRVYNEYVLSMGLYSTDILSFMVLEELNEMNFCLNHVIRRED